MTYVCLLTLRHSLIFILLLCTGDFFFFFFLNKKFHNLQRLNWQGSIKWNVFSLVYAPLFQFDIPLIIGGNKDEGILSYVDFLRLFWDSLLFSFVYILQCKAIRSEQFENRHFSWAYSLWTTRFDKFKRNKKNFCKCQFVNCSHLFASHCKQHQSKQSEKRIWKNSEKLEEITFSSKPNGE